MTLNFFLINYILWHPNNTPLSQLEKNNRPPRERVKVRIWMKIKFKEEISIRFQLQLWFLSNKSALLNLRDNRLLQEKIDDRIKNK